MVPILDGHANQRIVTNILLQNISSPKLDIIARRSISVCGWRSFKKWNRSTSPLGKIGIDNVTNVPHDHRSGPIDNGRTTPKRLQDVPTILAANVAIIDFITFSCSLSVS